MSKPPLNQIATGVLVIGLSVLVVILARENRQLKERLDDITKLPETLKPGDVVPVLKVYTLKGDSLEINFAKQGNRTLLFVFSTTCSVCLKSLDAWKEIADSVQRHGYTVVAVSTRDREKTGEYVKKYELRFPVYVARDSTFGALFKISFVPQTIESRANGLVQNNWGGLVDSARQLEILRSL